MKKTFLYALKKSLPVLVSFFPVGIAYGILMEDAGYNFLWSGGVSLSVYAGSLQYLMITFLRTNAGILTVVLMALLLNSRHIFYGIPFVSKWKEYGAWKWVLIFLLPDEAFSLHCANDFDDGNSKHKMYSYLFTALLIYFYWVLFSLLGGLIGKLITFDTTGLDFALTALFLVILIDQMRNAKTMNKRLPGLLAIISCLVCYILFGASYFIMPSLVITVTCLFLFRKMINHEVAHD